MSDLKERLRKVDSSGEAWGCVTTNWHRNPDGPEAADRIEALEGLLREAGRAMLGLDEGDRLSLCIRITNALVPGPFDAILSQGGE